MADDKEQQNTAGESAEAETKDVVELNVEETEAVDFVLGLAAESDRSAVILGAARLDVALERLLKQVMQHHPGGNDNLFDADRPLGSFAAKIALAHRLNLIDRHLEHALQMVRRLRNQFAHSVDKAFLSDSPHKGRVTELVRDAKTSGQWEGVHPVFAERAESASLADFCASVTILIVALEFGSSDTGVIFNPLSF